MATSYPNAIDSYTTKTDGVDTVSAAHINDPQDAIVAIETELGTNPRGPYASVGAGLAAKVSKAGDSMTGNLAMGNNRVTGLGAPTADGDAATKLYVDQQTDVMTVRFRDDFVGDKDARWTLGGTGGTYTQNAELGGTGDLATGAVANNEARLTLNGKGITDKNKLPRVTTRAKLSATTQVLAVLAGLYKDANNQVEIFYDQAGTAGNFKYRSQSGGIETVVDSGLAADAAYHKFEIEFTAATSITFRIDGANTQTVTTNIPSDLLEPRLLVQTKEAADKRLTVDLYDLKANR
jgi:hypothetical protein